MEATGRRSAQCNECNRGFWNGREKEEVQEEEKEEGKTPAPAFARKLACMASEAALNLMTMLSIFGGTYTSFMSLYLARAYSKIRKNGASSS